MVVALDGWSAGDSESSVARRRIGTALRRETVAMDTKTLDQMIRADCGNERGVEGERHGKGL